MPYGDIGKHMNKVSVGEPADGTPPYKGNLRSIFVALSHKLSGGFIQRRRYVVALAAFVARLSLLCNGVFLACR